MPLDSTYAGGTMLRRWYLVDGQPRCPFDAIDTSVMPSAVAGVQTQNTAAGAAWEAYQAYVAALALSGQDEPPATITQDDGTTANNPAHDAWVAAGQTVANASAVTLALAAFRAGTATDADVATLTGANIGFVLSGDLGADPLTADAAKADLTAYAAAARYAREIGGITFNGVPVATDRVSQAMVAGAFNYVQQNPSATINWKSGAGFVTLDAAAITAIANAVGAHVQACFATEASVSADIASGAITTTAQIDAAFA